jgi:hypothetical protein
MRTSRLILAVVASVIVLTGLYVMVRRPSSAVSSPPAVSPSSPEMRAIAIKPVSAPAPAVDSNHTEAAANSSPKVILARLAALKVSASQPQSIRQLILELEKLRSLGAAALPALREFLASGQDADYDSALGKIGFRDGKVPLDFAAPPSLRLGLLELVKNIGGPAAEDLLAHELKTTGRGVEAGYISAALEQLAPGKYRDASLAAARDLLAMPLSSTTKNPLDRSDREYLYHIVAMEGDRSQVAQAQSQLLLPTGQIDRGALRYLQEALGPAVVDIAMRAWNDPRVPANQREPLVRAALAWVGVDDHAEQFFAAAIADPNLSPGARKNLVEDLNQDGFEHPNQHTVPDLEIIERRLMLIDRLAPATKDPVLTAAFAEAKKDLVAMRDKAQRTANKK